MFDLLLGGAAPPPELSPTAPANDARPKRVRRPRSERRAGVRGFAAMDPEKLREISSKGGKASHASGRGHEFASGAEAQAAGRKGGLTVSRDLDHMADIGRKGANAKRRKGVLGLGLFG